MKSINSTLVPFNRAANPELFLFNLSILNVIDFLLRFRHGLFFGIRDIGLGLGAEAWDFVDMGASR